MNTVVVAAVVAAPILPAAPSISTPPENAAPASRIVGDFAKNSRERVVASLHEHAGRTFASVRVTVPTGGGGTVFTQAGVTVAVSQLPALRRLVEDLERDARAAGHLPAAEGA